ncbi:MAG: TAXI family TRAP transporter solute-binding subunit [Proteobacteria bacterium]|nr:TAXI family TRAP transporter solute-binding subunit [Pseudomonadota bacterium]
MNTRGLSVTAAAVALALIAAAPALAKPKSLTVLGGPVGGSWVPISAAMAKIFSDNGVPANAEIGSGLANLVNVSRGKGDVGLLVSTAAPDGRNGVAPFKEKITDVQGIASLYPNYSHVAVRKSSGINGLKDMKGKRLATGQVGSSSQQQFAQLLSAVGLSEADMIVSRGDFTFGANQFKDRNADVLTVITGAGNATFAELFATTDVKFVPVDEAIAAKMRAINPGYSLRTMPANSYPNQPEAVPAIVNDSILIVHEKMPTGDAYWVVKTLATNLDKFKPAHAALKDVTPKSMADLAGIDTHPGATRFFKEIGAVK